MDLDGPAIGDELSIVIVDPAAGLLPSRGEVRRGGVGVKVRSMTFRFDMTVFFGCSSSSPSLIVIGVLILGRGLALTGWARLFGGEGERCGRAWTGEGDRVGRGDLGRRDRDKTGELDRSLAAGERERCVEGPA